MKKLLALLLAVLLVLSMFAACNSSNNDETETNKNDEEQTETKGDEESEKESDKESDKKEDPTVTPACTHPDADKTYTSVDATNHKVTCKCGATVAETEAHVYDGDADMKCNKCDYDRTPPACTHADTTKTYTSVDATNHKVTCSCGVVVAETEAHTYANDATAKCDKCDYTRCIHADANGDYKCDNDCGTVIEPAAGTLSIADAIKLGNAFEQDKYSTNKYSVTGIIASVDQPYNTQFHNITVSISVEGTDGTLKCYRLSYDIPDGETDDKCATLYVGDEITVYGGIGNYNGAQLKQGKLTAVVPHTHSYDTEGWCTICGNENPEHTATHDCYDNNADCTCDHQGCLRLVLPAANTEITIEQALVIAGSKAHNTYSEKYYVRGTIDNIASTTYGNLTITDGTDSLYVYGTYNSDGSKRYDAMDTKPAVGDEVILYGIIGQYNGTLQMKNGWFVDAVPCTHESKTYADNGNGTHTWTCANTECGATDTENHIYDDDADMICNGTGCGFDRTPTGTCTHESKTYVDNGDGTHTWTCANIDCDDTVNGTGTEDHFYDDDADMICNGTGCGYDRTPHVCVDNSDPKDYVCDDTSCGKPVPPAADSTLTIPQAKALGVAHEHNTYTTETYKVSGIVIEADTWNTTHNNMTVIIMDSDGNTIKAYRLATQVALGDYITVTGSIGQYSNTAQIKAGATAEKGTAPDALIAKYLLETLDIENSYSGDAVITFPTFDGKTIEWKYGEEVVSGGSKTIAQTESVQNITKTISVTVGEVTKTKEVSFTVAAKPAEGQTTVTLVIGEQGLTNGTQYTSLDIDDNITATVTGGGNTGKYYTDGGEWRMYQSENPTIVIEAKDGYNIESVTIQYNVKNAGVLTNSDETKNIASGESVTVGSNSVTFAVGNTGDATKGQVKITQITVVYSEVTTV